jgi:YgiT-type zinc finger domain-containing protein
LVRRRVSVYRRRAGHHYLFQQVPALVCGECGFRVFEANAVESMEFLLKHPPGRSRRAELAILKSPV